MPIRAGDLLAKRLAESGRSTAVPIAATTTASARRRATPGAASCPARATYSKTSSSSGCCRTTSTTRFQDTDTDFTPERLFELIQSDEAWQMYHQLQLDGELACGADPVEPRRLLPRRRTSTTTARSSWSGTSITGRVASRLYSQEIESFGVWGGFALGLRRRFHARRRRPVQLGEEGLRLPHRIRDSRLPARPSDVGASSRTRPGRRRPAS